MEWSDVTKPASRTHLRQFAGLFLVVFGGMAAWRWFQGRQDAWTIGLGVVALVVGVTGMIAPAAVRPIYTGWMIAAFPIGWTVSRVILGTIFYVVVTPMAWIFRLAGRDLMARQKTASPSYWQPKAQPGGRYQFERLGYFCADKSSAEGRLVFNRTVELRDT